MYLRKFIQEKIWLLGIVILMCSVLTLNHIYFISSIAQYIYYGIYFILSIITINFIRKRYSLSIHHCFFILLNLLFIYVAYLNCFIALPLVFIFPLLCSGKSHWIFKIFSSISYVLLLLMLLLVLFVRVIFTSTTLVKTVNSQNNKQMIEVYSINEGALGGSTDVYLSDKFCYIFKKNRLIYNDGYGQANDVKWIDRNHVQIDNKNIDITSQ